MTILHSEDTNRLVQLAAEYHAGWENCAEMVVADFSEAGAEIVRMVSNQNPIRFSMTDDEMDALVEAWPAYRAEMRAQAEAALQHLQDIIDEAFKIALEHPDIKIKGRYIPGVKQAWEISVPSIGWGHSGPVSNPSDLLQMVKSARDAYLSHLALLATSER